MQRYNDCPAILRDFLVYHETIKGQSPLTISEYYLDLRLFLRFIKLMRNDMPMNTDLETIDIKDVDLQFIRDIDTSFILLRSGSVRIKRQLLCPFLNPCGSPSALADSPPVLRDCPQSQQNMRLLLR